MRGVDGSNRLLSDACLSETWGCRFEPPADRSGVAPLAVVTPECPDGSSTMLVVEAKRLVATRRKDAQGPGYL